VKLLIYFARVSTHWEKTKSTFSSFWC